MAKPAFEVFPYDLDRLVGLIADGSYRQPAASVRKKRHIKYFDTYLPAIHAKTLLVERSYIDRDFLEDFAAYYVRCFPDYQRACTRIHIFSNEFNADDFSSVLAGEPQNLTHDALQAGYLGFIVVKPLPETTIGRTCLQIYPDNGHRSFPATRCVDAHLFGIKLSVKHTLPFQEQDAIVAACATSALWSVFHSTARLFVHQILTPIEITKAATHLLPAETRVLPNRGLSTHMMAHAIKSVGLEPLLVRVSEKDLLQSAIYSYVRAGIPLILGAELVDDHGAGAGGSMGRHALAVVGYSLAGTATQLGGTGPKLRASRMDKIYAHDDQVGPFARMELDGKGISIPKYAGVWSLSTSWDSKHTGGAVRAVPDMLLVPLYHKVRIGWDWVLSVVAGFDSFISDLSKFSGAPQMSDLEWDVFLSDVNDVKADILASAVLDGPTKASLATQPMPKFIWRAIAHHGTQERIEILIDATDIETSDALVHVRINDATASALYKQVAAAPQFEASPINSEAKNILRWIRDH